MYLHIGLSRVIPFREVLGVFDLDQITRQAASRAFLEKAQAAGRLLDAGDKLPLSLVVTENWSYLSPISAQTLCRRLGEDQVL